MKKNTPIRFEQSIPGIFLENSQTRSLYKALAQLPSVSVASSGFHGGLASLFIRGANSNHNNVTLDDRSLPSGFANDYNITNLPVFDSGSIQLKTGGIGTTAIGGTIKLSSGNANFNKVEAEGGSFGLHREKINYSQTTNNSRFRIWTTNLQTHNFEPNNDYLNRNFFINLRHKKGPYAYQLLSYGQYEKLRLPGPRTSSFPRRGDYQDHAVYMLSPKIKISADKRVAFSAHYAFSTDNLESLASGTYVETESFSHELFSQILCKNERWESTSSVRFLSQKFHQTQSTTFLETWNKGTLSQDIKLAPFSKTKAKLNLTYSAHNQFNGDYSYSLALQHKFKYATPFASFARAINYPSANDVIWKSGNNLLSPEKAYLSQIGLKIPLGETVRLSLCGFWSYIYNLLECEPYPPYNTYNLAHADIKGIEASLSLKTKKLIAYLNYAFLKAYGKRGFGTYANGTRLLRRPKHKLTAGFQFKATSALTLGSDLSFRHNIIDSDPQTFARVKGDNYWIARIYASLKLSKNFKIFGRVENLFNHKYQDVKGYNALPLQAYIGLSYRF